MRKACKVCKRITDKDTCSICKEGTSQYWSGYLGITDPSRSTIAKNMNILIPGEYALKIR